jgi:hypothetical protein
VRRAGIIGGVVVAGVALGAYALGLFGDAPATSRRGDCYNLGVGEARSPDDALGLSTVVYVCAGRRDAAVTHVTLTAKHDDVIGPVFAADRNGGRAPEGPGEGVEVRVRWTGPRSAVIAHHPAARVVTKTARLGGVTLGFEAFR